MLPFLASSSSPAFYVVQIHRLLSTPLRRLLCWLIKYINRGDYPNKFDYAVWKLGLFLCSDVKLPSTSKYHVKCIECTWTNNLGGTNALANHAESKHRDIPSSRQSRSTTSPWRRRAVPARLAGQWAVAPAAEPPSPSRPRLFTPSPAIAGRSAPRAATAWP